MNIILDFLTKMYKVLETTLSFIVKGENIRLEIGTGGSYTDGKSIRIGVPEAFKGLPINTVYMMIVALIGHEGQHVLSSNFIEFKKYNEEEMIKLKAKGISESFASNYVHSVGNIIEDGRIENILVNRLPGFVSKIQYLNMFFWDKGMITKETDEFSAFINTILSLSVLGIYPKNYKFLKGSRVDKEIDKIKPLIFKGVKAKTCKDGLDICREILATAEPFVVELYKDIRKNEDRMQSLLEMLKDFIEEHKNSSNWKEEDLNDSHGHSSHINQGGEEGQKADAGKSNEHEPNSELDSDSDSESENSTTQSKGAGCNKENHEQKDTDISKKMKELAEKLKEESDKEIQKTLKDENKKQKNKPAPILSPQEKNDLTKEVIDTMGFKEISEKFPLNLPLPNETKISASKFKKQIKDIFQSKVRGNIGCQESGVLDTENVFRVGMGDYKVFKTEIVKNGRDHVLYFLRDGSGSMAGKKNMTSILSLAIMEEGLKGIVPFKAATFNSTRRQVQHIVIKDWNDNSKKNYAFNYIQRYAASGGNNDEVSIKIAAEELLRRPEKDKTLIILSDGLPASIEKTKQSIKEARSKGINIIGIMFGEEDFREGNLERYKYMYQKNIIASGVERIPDKLSNILKEILKN